MFKPRNSFLVVRLLEKKDQQAGGIVIPGSNSPHYTEAEVIHVGPGCEAMPGARSEMFDLKPGQRVYVKHKKPGRVQGELANEGQPFIENGEVLYILEQSGVLGVLAEPGEVPASQPVRPDAPVVDKLAQKALLTPVN